MTPKKYMHAAASEAFIFNRFIPAMKHWIGLAYPETFSDPRETPGTGPMNPNIYNVYVAATNGLLKMTTSIRFPATEPGNYSWLEDLLEDMLETDQDILTWLVINIPIVR